MSVKKEKKIERVGLYFNLDVPSEKKIWDYLKDKKKSYEIKKILESFIDENNVNPIISGPQFKAFNSVNDIPKVDINEAHIDENELDNDALNGF